MLCWQCLELSASRSRLACCAGAAAMFSSYRRLDCYSLLQQPLPGVEVHVVRAEQSDRWSTKELQQLGKVAEQSGVASVSTDPCEPWTVLAQQRDPFVTG